MNKIPKTLPNSPITVACPFCKAKPGKDCDTSGSFAIVHVERIAAAAAKDRATRATR